MHLLEGPDLGQFTWEGKEEEEERKAPSGILTHYLWIRRHMIYSCAAVHEFELLKRMSGFLPQESVKRIRFHQVPKPNSTFVGSGSGNDGANKNSDNRSSVLREVRSFNPLRIKKVSLSFSEITLQRQLLLS